MSEFLPRQKEIFNGVRSAARLILAGTVAAITVIVARLLSRSETVSFAGVDLPIQYSWVLFVCLTLAHCFVSTFLVRSIQSYVYRLDVTPEEREDVFAEIKAEANPFLHGLIPRTEQVSGVPGVVRMSSHDPSTWISCAAVGALLFAVLPWKVTAEHGLQWERGWPGVVLLVVALALTVTNWYAASRWIIWLSYLGRPDDHVRPAEPWSGPGISTPTGVPIGVSVAPFMVIVVVLIVRGCT